MSSKIWKAASISEVLVTVSLDDQATGTFSAKITNSSGATTPADVVEVGLGYCTWSIPEFTGRVDIKITLNRDGPAPTLVGCSQNGTVLPCHRYVDASPINRHGGGFEAVKELPAAKGATSFHLTIEAGS